MKMVAIAKLLKLIPSMALAFAALYLIPSASDFLLDLSSSCHSFPRIGNPDIDEIMNMGVDGFLCMLCLASKSSIQSLEGFVSLGYLMSLSISCFAFMAIEGSRSRAGLLLSLTPLYAILFRLLGLSVVFPLLWLPVYLLYGCDERTPENAWARSMGISLPRVVAIAVSITVLFQFITIGALFPFEDARMRDYFGLAFLFFPVLIPFAWAPFQGKTRGAHEAIITMYLLLAGCGIVCHLVGLLAVVHIPELPARILGLLSTHPVGGESHFQYLRIIELLVIILSLLYLVALEAGPMAMLTAIAGTIFFGPAATFSFYFALREQQIMRAVAITAS